VQILLAASTARHRAPEGVLAMHTAGIGSQEIFDGEGNALLKRAQGIFFVSFDGARCTNGSGPACALAHPCDGDRSPPLSHCAAADAVANLWVTPTEWPLLTLTAAKSRGYYGSCDSAA